MSCLSSPLSGRARCGRQISRSDMLKLRINSGERGPEGLTELGPLPRTLSSSAPCV